jgi:hypothetical protein
MLILAILNLAFGVLNAVYVQNPLNAALMGMNLVMAGVCLACWAVERAERKSAA